MARSKTLVLLALGAVLLLMAQDCLSSGKADKQSMECCASMPCTPSNQSHGCCKAMVSSPSPYFQVAAKASFEPPLLVTSATLAEPALAENQAFAVEPLEANEHAPPRELYTLHHSFLI